MSDNQPPRPAVGISAAALRGATLRKTETRQADAAEALAGMTAGRVAEYP